MVGLKGMHVLRKGNEGCSCLGMLCGDQYDWKKVLLVVDADVLLSLCYYNCFMIFNGCTTVYYQTNYAEGTSAIKEIVVITFSTNEATYLIVEQNQ